MVLILGLALIAIISVKSYNSQIQLAPEATASGVTALRQSTGVVLSLGKAVVAILDALQLITRPSRDHDSRGFVVGARVHDYDAVNDEADVTGASQ